MAVNANYDALRLSPAVIKNDTEIVLAAVTQNGTALEYASPCMRNKKKVVLAAVQNYPHDVLRPRWPLEFVGDSLREDRHVNLSHIPDPAYSHASDPTLKTRTGMLMSPQ